MDRNEHAPAGLVGISSTMVQMVFIAIVEVVVADDRMPGRLISGHGL